MNEVAISLIQEYAQENLSEPKANWPKYYFDKRSYSRWAIDELTNRFIEQKNVLSWGTFKRESKTPVEIIIEFIDGMGEIAERSDNKEIRFIFHTAREVATEILYQFL